jgi:hypothetical protein
MVPFHGDGAGGGVGAGAVVGGARARQNQTGFAGDGRGTEGLDWKLDGVAEKERKSCVGWDWKLDGLDLTKFSSLDFGPKIPLQNTG